MQTENEMANIFTETLRRRFPVGTSEVTVIATLRGQGF
jgi:hypothetical protein